MSKKQLSTLFLCSLIYWTVGNGLLPLLPVYATQLGAAPSVIGSYLSIIYIGLAMGTIIAGWLSDKFQQRKIMLIINGVLSIPVCWLMGRVTNIWYLTALTAGLWFLGGFALTLLSILTGLFAEKTRRGKYFGILSMAASASLWHFCLSISLLAVLMQTSRAVGSALVTDLVPSASLGRGISLFTATTWIGGIIGFGTTGYAIQNLGLFFTLIMGACLPLAAIVLLIPIGQPEKDKSIPGEVA
jgi:MFS family permease